jgi:hypothetical protein
MLCPPARLHRRACTLLVPVVWVCVVAPAPSGFFVGARQTWLGPDTTSSPRPARPSRPSRHGRARTRRASASLPVLPLGFRRGTARHGALSRFTTTGCYPTHFSPGRCQPCPHPCPPRPNGSTQPNRASPPAFARVQESMPTRVGRGPARGSGPMRAAGYGVHGRRVQAGGCGHCAGGHGMRRPWGNRVGQGTSTTGSGPPKERRAPTKTRKENQEG